MAQSPNHFCGLCDIENEIKQRCLDVVSEKVASTAVQAPQRQGVSLQLVVEATYRGPRGVPGKNAPGKFLVFQNKNSLCPAGGGGGPIFHLRTRNLPNTVT